MAVVALLRRLVVIRADHERAVGPGPLGEPRQPNRLARAVRPGAWHDLDPPGGPLDHRGDYALVLFVIERRRFARGADWGQAVRSLLDVPINQPAQVVKINLAALER